MNLRAAFKPGLAARLRTKRERWFIATKRDDIVKRKMSNPVRDTLLTRCMMEWAKRKEIEKICDASERLFDSLWGRLTPAEREEYESIVHQARIDETLKEGTSTPQGPN
jgi:hypothetical protein